MAGNKTGRRLIRAALLLMGFPLLYLLAALLGALVPRNAGWEEPPAGVEIFVRTNGVHADLVLPARAEGVDWHAIVPPDHVAAAAGEPAWVAIGWGQRDFYLETERWEDLTFRVAVRALTGGDALIHVAHRARPEPSPTHRPLRLSPDAYLRMAEAVRRSFRVEEGRPVPLVGTGYGDDDVFYEAEGRYHAFRTSNQWTADILAHGGVRIGIWTPFAQGIMWRFRTGDEDRSR